MTTSLKHNISLSFIFLTCIFLALPGGTADASELAAGKAKAEAICQTCHGMDGRGTMPMVANIGGQQEDYIIGQLKAYKSGRRKHEQMSIIVQSLSDDDVRNVAKWYSSVKVTFKAPE